ncbi:hypothetical protein PFNF54_05706 [Plasmodium falciparum NF54]|uniref:Uncharacterized protein n=1 Tax=Plasmodium falciparum (isolate NF54) TaxID=5843 RepID=W7JKX4_PLAFO|nr:hypothetical protein PFNF54_05706 [Plasmodium falciparum NF54]
MSQKKKKKIYMIKVFKLRMM